MQNSVIPWDPALLREFSSTGHFRLLNQVRSELKAQPLKRDPDTRTLNLQARPIRGASPKSNRRPNALENQDANKQPIVDFQEESPKTFRQRLNAIEMR